MIEVTSKEYLLKERIYLIDEEENKIIILNREDEKPITGLYFDTVLCLAEAIKDLVKKGKIKYQKGKK